MINLITGFFIPKEEERIDELIKCLIQNINCPYIKKIHLLIENKDDIDFLKNTIKITKNKIQLILWNKQPTYRDYLDMANGLIGEICMISNADIWLKQVDRELLEYLYKTPNIGYALTRHESDGSTPMFDSFIRIKNGGYSKICIGSFDAFIFKAPKFITGNINHVQNIPGSEHIFKYFMEKEGKIKFYNPCKDIIIIHEHTSEIRHYKEGDLLFISKSKNKKEHPAFKDPNYPTYYKLIRVAPMDKNKIIIPIVYSSKKRKTSYKPL